MTRHEPRVTLQIAGEDVDPAALTREFGIPPTHSGYTPAAPDDGSQVHAAHGFWVLDTRGVVPGQRLTDHLNWLADQLQGHEDVLRACGAKGCAQLYADGAPSRWELDISVEVARARLDVSLSFVKFVKGPTDIQVQSVRYE